MPARRLVLALALTLAAALVSGQPVAAADRILVFAAASLKTALDRIAADWETAGGAPVTVSYAGTPALAQQIEAGAPADLFLSASVDWMDALEAEGLLRKGTRRDIVGNRLVLVRHGPGEDLGEIGTGFGLPEMLGDGRLAMALVDAVPAGIYGRAALDTLGLWPDVESKVAQTDSVRAALALVAAGEAPFGIVYASDARAEPGVSVAGHFPDDSHPPIVYPGAVLAEASHPEAEALLAHLASEPAQAVFAAEGFLPPPDP